MVGSQKKSKKSNSNILLWLENVNHLIPTIKKKKRRGFIPFAQESIAFHCIVYYLHCMHCIQIKKKLKAFEIKGFGNEFMVKMAQQPILCGGGG